MTGEPAGEVTRTEMWFEERTSSVIYLRPVTGGGHGWHVKLATDVKSVGRDYLRETYCSDLLEAMKRIVWLMDNIVPGTWTRVPHTAPAATSAAADCDPAVTPQPYAGQNTTKGTPS